MKTPKYAVTEETRGSYTILTTHRKLDVAQAISNRRNRLDDCRTDSGQPWYAVRIFAPMEVDSENWDLVRP